MTIASRHRHRTPTPRHRARGWLALAGLLAIAGCASSPEEPPASRPPLPSPHVSFAPAKGQDPAQVERDRYECFQWAITRTGFDPSRARTAPATAIDEERLANRIQHFRRAMTACLTGRNYRVD
jgi:hypothetical protein